MDRAPPSAAPFAVVVDDNPVILLHATDMLADAGFSVFSAADSDVALGQLELHGDKVVLLFTNVEIPGPMDGFALARHVAARWPHAVILVSSGRFEPAANDMPDGAVFLPKPYTSQEVLGVAHTMIRIKNPKLLKTAALVF